ncbi:MAG: tetratricopeptide repeat protein [Planctomycetes bacterium]|nr:tetratricopeptide repeat protein [Planctomycetota bacterium]
MPYDDDINPIESALDSGFATEARSLARDLAARCNAATMARLAEAYNTRGKICPLTDLWLHRERKRGLDASEAEPFADTLNTCAVDHMRNGRMPEARTLLHTAREVAPKLVYVRRNLASAALEMGEFAAAMDELDRALTMFPDEPSLLEMRGRVLYQSGDVEISTEFFQRAFDGGSADAGLWLIKAQCVDARIDEAIEDIEALLKRHPERGLALLQAELENEHTPLHILFDDERSRELINDIRQG